jgi:hypothetical protein
MRTGPAIKGCPGCAAQAAFNATLQLIDKKTGKLTIRSPERKL